MKTRSSARMFPTQTVVAVSILLMLLGNPVLPAAASQRTSEKPAGEERGLATLPAKAKRYALIIGVKEYRDPAIGKLEGPSNDANGLANALVERAGFPRENVIVLASDQAERRKPTRTSIVEAISTLKKQVGDGLLLLSFSGHGIERAGEGYLLPEDARLTDDVKLLEQTSISVGTVRSWIREMWAPQVLMVFDACRNNPEAAKSESKTVLTETFKRALNFKAVNQGIKAFATLYATRVGQVAYENTRTKLGYFTEALVEALVGAASNKMGEVTLSGLVSYVQEHVPKRVMQDLGKEQQPWAEISGYRATELVISRIRDTAVRNVIDTRYGFEDGPMGWRPERKADDSLACKDIAQSDERSHEGYHSLKVDLDLDARDRGRGKGEVRIILEEYPPEGDELPLDLTGCTVTAWVYAPQGLRGDEESPSGYQIFLKSVKDGSWKGALYGSWHNVVEGEWIQLKLKVSTTAEKGGFVTPEFDPNHIAAVGIKIALGGKSKASYKGPLYVDAIAWNCK